MASFTQTIEQMRAKRGIKWRRYGEEAIGAWVADMDFTPAPAIQAAIRKIVDEQDYAYASRDGDAGLANTFAWRMKTLYNWEPDPALVVPVPDLVQALYSNVMVFSQPGDGVVTQTPIYPPFLMAIDSNNRQRVENPMVDDGSRFVIDLDGLRRAAASSKIIMLCNPHNPTGRVFTRAELQAIGDVAVERDLIIICDEIHSDLVYTGSTHIPIATLSPAIAERTITVTSATKGFNIPGLKCALMHFGSQALLDRYSQQIPLRLLGGISSPGIDATVAAWRHGQGWLSEVMAHLDQNRKRIATFLKAEIPAIHYYPPEATYLAWLNCAKLNLPAETPQKFFLEHAKVAFNPGGDFGPPGVTCVRLNFGTSADILEEILARMAQAVRAVT